MPQMKAIQVSEFGDPDVLEHVDVERPSPGEGEVLIEVKAAGVNYADTMRRRISTSKRHHSRSCLALRSPA